MEILFVILISVCICLFLRPIIISLLLPSKRSVNLPPGPATFPVIGNLFWLRKSSLELEAILADFCNKHGPLATIQFGSRPSIFIADRFVAHSALIHNGAVFADRPSALAVNRIISSKQHNISSSFYGPTWRLLRRNLTSEILHPSRVGSYSPARKWVLEILIYRLRSSSESGQAVLVVGHFQYAMFCLLVLMCFGDKLDESKIKEIEQVQRDLLLNLRRFNILNFLPNLSKIFFSKRWALLYQILANQENVLIPLIKGRIKAKEESMKNSSQEEEFVVAYVDTLLDLHLPEEKRKLKDSELVSLCSEFLNAGTDTTSTALQWIMANLVKYPDVQNKVFEELKATVGEGEREVKEEDLGKLHYLKAVVLEGLRRHPPGHFVLPHAVREDVDLEGYTIPKNCSVNFMVANMGWDPKVWEDPMAFKPERFIKQEDDGKEVNFDITGSKEIKMMPFGAGRRICPGYGLAILHLEYFVANLVWNFEWKGVEGEDVDLSEKQEFTIVMKNPLQAHLRPRSSIL